MNIIVGNKFASKRLLKAFVCLIDLAISICTKRSLLLHFTYIKRNLFMHVRVNANIDYTLCIKYLILCIINVRILNRCTYMID